VRSALASGCIVEPLIELVELFEDCPRLGSDRIQFERDDAWRLVSPGVHSACCWGHCDRCGHFDQGVDDEVLIGDDSSRRSPVNGYTPRCCQVCCHFHVPWDTRLAPSDQRGGVIRWTGAIPRPSGRGYAPSFSDTLHRFQHRPDIPR